MNVKEIFYEVIREASNCKVIIDNEEWFIGFNTVICVDNKIECSLYNDKNMSTLIIKNEDIFIKYLSEYIDLELKINRKGPSLLDNSYRNKVKLLISYLFVNASINDFENSIDYLQRRINFLNDNYFDNIDIYLGKIFSPKINEDIKLELKKIVQDIRMETPYKLEFNLVSGSSSFKLPSVSYAIDGDICYLYSISNSKQIPDNKDEEEYIKKINRFLYKINNGKDQPKEVSDVSVSFVLSLVIFINLLKNNNINKLRTVLYLPVRYLSRDISSEKFHNEDLSNRNDLIQSNLTDKLLTTLMRICYNLDGVSIVNDITIDNGYVDVVLNNKMNNSNNELLNNVTNNMLNIEKNKCIKSLLLYHN